MTRDAIARDNEWASIAPRMREVRHVHADHDPRAWHWFVRGPIVAADGGRRRAADRDARRERNVEDEQLRDVSHRANHDPDANRVWERGAESDSDADEAAE